MIIMLPISISVQVCAHRRLDYDAINRTICVTIAKQGMVLSLILGSLA